ncbi:MAG: alpha/beta hydrolase [Gallionella sp.]|nr:alpha/beta hydrolase [Gallionella sp.]
MIKIAGFRRIAVHAVCIVLFCCGWQTPCNSAVNEKPSLTGASAQSMSTADMLASITAIRPKSNAESILLLKAKTEAMERLATDTEEMDEKVALAFCISAINDAKKLFGDQTPKLVPVLRVAAQVALRFNQASRAVELLLKAEKISEMAIGTDDPAGRFIQAELAQAYAQAGQASKAKAAKDRADYLEKISVAAIEGGDTLGSNEVSDSNALYQIIPVFFKTTRVMTSHRDSHVSFGTSRDDQNDHYGVSYVSVPKKRDIGTIPHPSVFRLDLRTDPSRHVILKEIVEISDQNDFWKTIKRRLTSTVRKEALIYIHGFNQSFQDGVETAATLSADLEIDGGVVSFSWPSRNNLLLYSADIDEATADRNRDALCDLLSHLAAETGAQHVYVIAHSMGNRLLLEALRLMGNTESQPPIDKLIFASPDMESADFTRAVGKIGALSKRMTLYTANGDLALNLSNKLRGVWSQASRAGDRDGGVKPTELLDVVDASKAKADLLGHSNFMHLAKDDLRALVWFGLPAERRCILMGKRSEGWRYNPASPCTSEAFTLASLYFRRYADGVQALSQLSSLGDSRSRSASIILRAMLVAKK